jgi:hypothetical protein
MGLHSRAKEHLHSGVRAYEHEGIQHPAQGHPRSLNAIPQIDARICCKI